MRTASENIHLHPGASGEVKLNARSFLLELKYLLGSCTPVLACVSSLNDVVGGGRGEL